MRSTNDPNTPAQESGYVRVEALEEEHACDVSIDERVGTRQVVIGIVRIFLAESTDDVQHDDQRELT